MSNGMNRCGRGEALRNLLSMESAGPPAPVKPEVAAIAAKSGGRGSLFSSFSSPPAERTSPENNTVSPNPTGFGRASLIDRLKRDTDISVRRDPKPEPVEDQMSALRLDSSSSGSNRTSSPVIMKGTSGSPISMVTNYIRLDSEPDKGVFQYHVTFEPEVDSKFIRMKLMNQLKETIKYTKSFDGAILYLPFKLDSDVTTVDTTSHDGREITVKLKYVKQLQMGDPEAVTLYNIIFNRIMHILGFVAHGRHYFDPHAAQPIPEHKLEVWPGHVTAVHNFEDGVMLCCDSSHRVLRNLTVHELMQDLVGLSERTWQTDFMNLVIGQTVLTRYNNKVYRIDDVDFDSTANDQFELKKGDKISYVNYYEQRYGVQIKDPGQPLLKSRVKRKVKGAEILECVDLIPELCYLSGITDSMRSDHKVMKAIAHCTRIPPAQRQACLEKFLYRIHSSAEATQLLSDWGLRLSKKNLTLPGRVVASEDIIFNNSRVNKGCDADWGREAARSHVLSPVHLKSWVIICTKRDENVVKEFATVCNQVSSKMGIDILNPKIVTISNDSTQNFIQQLAMLNGQAVQLVLILLPVARNDKYSAIKKMCCIDNPIPSQVVITRTIRNPQRLRAITQKIVLQMNCKLGGTLWQVHIPVQSSMIVGLDTFHDGANKSNSVGAVVASMDPSLTRWYSTIYRQGVGVELIDGLEISITRTLTKYKETNGQLPNQIIVYRDGVGDGQLQTCSLFEIPQIVRACKKMDPDYSPNLLVVIVAKRISTRLFAVNGKELSNPPPGSIMDHSITRRDMYDFFLVSQNIQQGTVSPTHYIVIHNTTKMNPDKVQRLTYKMTHLYYNWCGTIRVPAPCQYAHKLAYLVGEHLLKDADELLKDKLFYL